MVDDNTTEVTPSADLTARYFCRIMLTSAEARSFVLDRLWRGLEHYNLDTPSGPMIYASVDDLRQWCGAADFCSDAWWDVLIEELAYRGAVAVVRKQTPEAAPGDKIFWVRPVSQD